MGKKNELHNLVLFRALSESMRHGLVTAQGEGTSLPAAPNTKGEGIMIKDVYEMRSSSPSFHMLACVSPRWDRDSLWSPEGTAQGG